MRQEHVKIDIHSTYQAVTCFNTREAPLWNHRIRSREVPKYAKQGCQEGLTKPRFLKLKKLKTWKVQILGFLGFYFKKPKTSQI